MTRYLITLASALVLAGCGKDAPSPPTDAAEPRPAGHRLDIRPDGPEDGADRALDRLVDEGLTALVDAKRGVCWDAGPGAPTWLRSDTLGEGGRALGEALKHGLSGARCRDGRCLIIGPDETRWYLRLRRRPGGGRSLAGVLRTQTAPEPARYGRWLDAIRDGWSGATGALIGQALSAEEGGDLLGAGRDLAAAHAADPENSWVPHHLVRLLVAQGEPKLGYVAFRALAERADPEAVAAVVRLAADKSLVSFRAHSAVAPHLKALAEAPPDDPRPWLEHLRRYRGASSRLAALIAPGGPSPDDVRTFLEARLLEAPDQVGERELRWPGGEGLALGVSDDGALRITGLLTPH